MLQKVTGDSGEEKACKFLIEKGYNIRDRNYRYRRNEIDIIAQNEGQLVFIEVKTKSYHAFGPPELSVDQAKADRVMEAAENYIYENGWYGDIRFDIISITMLNEQVKEISHFEDAFH